jgi:SAM-dependent methyltransferase
VAPEPQPEPGDRPQAVALVRADPERLAAALGVLRPLRLLVAADPDPGPPHEWELALRGLLGRSERGRPRREEVERAFADAARAAADEVAARARELGFEVTGVVLAERGPRGLERLLEHAPAALLLIEGRHPMPPHLRHLVERHDGPVLVA